MIKHYNITVSGKVQGVFFRAFTQKEAQRLQLHGFVNNQSNGDVYMEVEGEETILNEFINWCKMGSPKAVVKDVKITEANVKSFVDFKIDK